MAQQICWAQNFSTDSVINSRTKTKINGPYIRFDGMPLFRLLLCPLVRPVAEEKVPQLKMIDKNMFK